MLNISITVSGSSIMDEYKEDFGLFDTAIRKLQDVEREYKRQCLLVRTEGHEGKTSVDGSCPICDELKGCLL